MNLTKREIEKFRELGLLDEIAYRNHQIRKEFYRRKKIAKKKKPSQIKLDLAQEYCISVDTIHKAIYKMHCKHKKIYFPK